MDKKYKSNNNVVYSCKYHVVWCPKYRRKVLTGQFGELHYIKPSLDPHFLRKSFKTLKTLYLPNNYCF